MTGINHAVTGAVVAKLLPWPLAVPVAFLSHFVLDSLPHFGEVLEKRRRLSKTIWTIYICLVAGFLTYLISSHEWAALAAAVAAMSPDFAWVYRFAIQERFGRLPPKPEGRFNAWHARIQRYESRAGFAFELVWLAGMAVIFMSRVRP